MEAFTAAVMAIPVGGGVIGLALVALGWLYYSERSQRVAIDTEYKAYLLKQASGGK